MTLNGRLFTVLWSYSQSPLNPYPSVTGFGYGLLERMGLQDVGKNDVKLKKKIEALSLEYSTHFYDSIDC